MDQLLPLAESERTGQRETLQIYKFVRLSSEWQRFLDSTSIVGIAEILSNLSFDYKQASNESTLVARWGKRLSQPFIVISNIFKAKDTYDDKVSSKSVMSEQYKCCRYNMHYNQI